MVARFGGAGDGALVQHDGAWRRDGRRFVVHELMIGFAVRQLCGIFFAQVAERGNKFVERDQGRKHEDLGVTAVRDRDAGMELPAGVLKSDLDGDAVGGGGFDHAAAAVELVAAGGAGGPADDAVDGRGVADGSRRIEFEREDPEPGTRLARLNNPDSASRTYPLLMYPTCIVVTVTLSRSVLLCTHGGRFYRFC